MRAFAALLLLAAALAPAARAGRSLQQPMETVPLQPEPLPAAARDEPITVEAPMGLAPLTELFADFAPAPEAEVSSAASLSCQSSRKHPRNQPTNQPLTH